MNMILQGWETNEGNLEFPDYSLKSFLRQRYGEENTRVETNELRIWSWAFGKNRVTIVHKIEYWEGKSYTERFWKSADSPPSAEMLSTFQNWDYISTSDRLKNFTFHEDLGRICRSVLAQSWGIISSSLSAAFFIPT